MRTIVGKIPREKSKKCWIDDGIRQDPERLEISNWGELIVVVGEH